MNYVPDSVYSVCGDITLNCGNCKNEVYSTVLSQVVDSPHRGKVFCPFGKGESMNQGIFTDQFLVTQPRTRWGNAPQLDPRPLTRIGLSWRTS
jgi:hypothetical protein